MPDHVHLLAEGLTPRADLRRFVSSFKQKSGFAFAKQRAARLWQDGYHDRILRNDETTLKVARYIPENQCGPDWSRDSAIIPMRAPIDIRWKNW
jgi:REP element-mobilizing transposase RayT